MLPDHLEPILPEHGVRSSLDEAPEDRPEGKDILPSLLRLGGFPEPFLWGDDAFHAVWLQERNTMLIRQDIRDATRIRDLSLLEVTTHLLPGRVGSPLSLHALREDVGVAFDTVRTWMEVLARFYYVFTIPPFAGSLARSLKKEAKVYLFHWAEVPDEGPRFENLVAFHLHKAVQTWRALGQGDLSLHYVRDREHREVDFLVADSGRPALLVEAKASGGEQPSPALAYYQDRLDVPVAVQLVGASGRCRRLRGGSRSLWVVSADRWLARLP